jgi:hypothetical protein
MDSGLLVKALSVVRALESRATTDTPATTRATTQTPMMTHGRRALALANDSVLRLMGT